LIFRNVVLVCFSVCVRVNSEEKSTCLSADETCLSEAKWGRALVSPGPSTECLPGPCEILQAPKAQSPHLDLWPNPVWHQYEAETEAGKVAGNIYWSSMIDVVEKSNWKCGMRDSWNDCQAICQINEALGGVDTWICDGTKSFTDFFGLQGQTHMNPGSGRNELRIHTIDLLGATMGPNANGFLHEAVGRLEHLQFLRIRDSRMMGPIPVSIGNLSKLEEIDMPQNRLSGTLPSTIGNLQKLGYLQLAHNHLSGTIPSSYGYLGALYELNLAGNQLTGMFPAGLGNLRKLLMFRLNNNLFTARHGQALCNLFVEDMVHLHLNDNLNDNLNRLVEDVGSTATQAMCCLGTGYLDYMTRGQINQCMRFQA